MAKLWAGLGGFLGALNVHASVCYFHSGVTVPGFSHYQYSLLLDSTKSSKDSSEASQDVLWLVTATTTLEATYAARHVVSQFASSTSTSGDVLAMLAMLPMEIQLPDFPEGKDMAFKEGGKPLFVHRRIQQKAVVEVSQLRDQKHDLETE